MRAIRRKVTVYYRKMGDVPSWQENGKAQKSMPGKMGSGKKRKSKSGAAGGKNPQAARNANARYKKRKRTSEQNSPPRSANCRRKTQVHA
ncbi:MAG: hypothetical protein HZB51_21930 [Chloroflexi bacterium]|nr:hypothetical protein [Chloroflexota bacterium]